jgi:hypothetical protein
MFLYPSCSTPCVEIRNQVLFLKKNKVNFVKNDDYPNF